MATAVKYHDHRKGGPNRGFRDRSLVLFSCGMKRLDQVFAWTLFVLGIIHSALTPLVNRQFTLAAVWFFGTGMALIVTGLLNFIRIRHTGALALLRGTCIAANSLTFAVAVAAAWVMRTALPGNPQVPVLLIASFGEILLSTRKA